MATTGLRGPFKLTDQEINSRVQAATGAYALDTGTDQDTFRVFYVGRSDVDVKARLKQHVGKFARFKFEYFSTPKAAFEKECSMYHDFNPTLNVIHPARPDGSGWRCPSCKLFG